MCIFFSVNCFRLVGLLLLQISLLLLLGFVATILFLSVYICTPSLIHFFEQIEKWLSKDSSSDWTEERERKNRVDKSKQQHIQAHKWLSKYTTTIKPSTQNYVISFECSMCTYVCARFASQLQPHQWIHRYTHAPAISLKKRCSYVWTLFFVVCLVLFIKRQLYFFCSTLMAQVTHVLCYLSA